MPKKPASTNKITNYFHPIPQPSDDIIYDTIVVGPASDTSAKTKAHTPTSTQTMTTVTALSPIPETQPAGDRAGPLSSQQSSTSHIPENTASLQLQRENFAALNSTTESGSGSVADSRGSGRGQTRVIPSSDGEESSEDSDGLEDVSKLLRLTKPKTPTVETTTTAKNKKSKPLPFSAKSSVTLAPKKPLNFSLEKLVQQKSEAAALSSQIEQSKKSKKLLEAVNSKPAGKVANGTGVSRQELGKTLGKVGSERLAATLSKDTWRVEKSWHLFDTFNERSCAKENPFPAACLPNSRWLALLSDVEGRQQAFLTGFVRDMVEIGLELPDEILVWMLDELCLEPRQDLAYAYATTLESLQLQKIKELITSERIIHLFKLLGGRPEALELKKQITLTPSSRLDDKPRDFWNVKLIVTFLGNVAVRHRFNTENIRADNAVIQTACGLLVRLALDVRICMQGDILAAIDDVMEDILQAIPEDEWDETMLSISQNLLTTITTHQYRYRALSILPVHTSRLHAFRRRLALAFIFEEPSYLIQDYSSLVCIHSLSCLLRKPQFGINSQTDYFELQALICILDIAIDDGAVSGEDAENDRELDALVETLRTMFSRIIDNNAQNLNRTEAKDTIERLQFRLRFAVRNKEYRLNILDGLEWDVGDDDKREWEYDWEYM